MTTTLATRVRATLPRFDAADLAAVRTIFREEPDTRAVAVWDDGDFHLWGQATVDNRPARVAARIRTVLGGDPATLVVIHRAQVQ